MHSSVLSIWGMHSFIPLSFVLWQERENIKTYFVSSVESRIESKEKRSINTWNIKGCFLLGHERPCFTHLLRKVPEVHGLTYKPQSQWAVCPWHFKKCITPWDYAQTCMLNGGPSVTATRAGQPWLSGLPVCDPEAATYSTTQQSGGLEAQRPADPRIIWFRALAITKERRHFQLAVSALLCCYGFQRPQIN